MAVPDTDLAGIRRFCDMTYDPRTAGWTLYWFDRNSRAHVYEFLEPGQPIERLLAEHDDDPTCIFKG